jgi:enoyl-CoA hydratase/carnithine racemase
MPDVVRLEVRDRVAMVSLNRPEKLNAMSPEVFAGLAAAGREVQGNDDVRAVLLRGEGRAFCSGLDLSSIGAIGGRADASGNGEQRRERGQAAAGAIADLQVGFVVWSTMDKPVVAAVQGYALGAGFQLALAADIRFVATNASLSVFEITYGLVPDLGATARLPELAGPARAKELIWTARRFGAEEAERWGIANRVVEPDDLENQAFEFARDLASRPPLPIRFSKELVGLAGTMPLADQVRREQEYQARCIGSADAKEAIAASFEKREGVYKGA